MGCKKAVCFPGKEPALGICECTKVKGEKRVGNELLTDPFAVVLVVSGPTFSFNLYKVKVNTAANACICLQKKFFLSFRLFFNLLICLRDVAMN